MTAFDSARSLLANALKIEPENVAQDTTIESCSAWDSLAHFRVIAALEVELERPLAPNEVFDISDFASVLALVESKG